MKYRNVLTGFCALAFLSLGACSTTDASGRKTMLVQGDFNELELDRVPGTVSDVWVEPMYDTIRIPGQPDPHGVYYRLPHTGLVEIRNGRFQQTEFPHDRPADEHSGQ